MKRFLFFSLVILPISLFAEGGLPDRPYIYVQGTAEIEKPADMLTMKFEVVGNATDQSKAHAEAQSRANKIFAMLKAHKIADNDVIAENIQTEPQFEQEEKFGQRHDKLIGYKVIRQFEVKLRELSVYPKFIDELIALGGVEFREDVVGGLSKEKEIGEQLREKALNNARERAEKISKAMGVKIESIFGISTAPFPQVRTKIFGEEAERVIVTGSNIPTATFPAPQYNLAPIKVSEDVYVIYLISPAK